MAISAKELGELVIKITAETKDAEAAMERIQSAVARTSAGGKGDLYELEKAASRVGVGFTSLGRLCTRVGSTITTKITTPLIGVGAAAGKTALDFIQLKEQTRISFETMLGSADKAKKLMSEIYEFSKTTPFSQETFYNAAKQLLAMGFSAKETKKELEAFTNASIATGKGADGIETLTRAFGKMNAAGKVSLEGLNMITDMGVPAIDILANAYKVNKEELFGMIRQGEILSDEALPKLLEGMQNGTKGVNGVTAAYGELASKMKEGTIMGALDSLHSAWRNFALAIFDMDTDEKQQEKSKKLIELLGEVKRVLNNLAPVFGNVTKNVDGLLDKVIELTKAFADFLENTPKDELAKIGDTLIAIAKAGPAFLMLGGALKVIGSAFRGVSGIAKIADEFKKLGGVSGTVKTFSNAVGKIGTKVSGASAALGKFIGKSKELPTVLRVITAPLRGLTGLFGPLAIAIVAVTSVIVWLKRNWELVTEVMKEFSEKIHLEEKFKKIEEAFSELAQVMGGDGGDIFQSLGDIFEFVGGVIMGVLVPAFAVLAGVFDGIVSAISGIIEAFTGVVEIIQGIIDVISGFVTGDMEKVKEGLDQIRVGIGDVFHGLGDAIIGALSGIIEGVGEFVIELIEQFTGCDLSGVEEFGKNIGEGIKNGWDSFCSTVGSWAESLWDILSGGIASVFGMHSPAKNTEPWGQNIAEGIKNGWDNFVNGAGSWAQGLWSFLSGGFSGLVGSAKETGAKLGKGIEGGVKGAQGLMQGAGKLLGTAAKGGAEGIVGLMQAVGKKLGLNLKGGVTGNISLLKSAGTALANAAKNGVTSIFNSAATWGSHLASNIASGIRNGISSIGSAAKAAADAAAKFLKHTVPKAGPLKDEMDWMPHMIDNLTSTLKKSSPKLVDAASGLAADMQDSLSLSDFSVSGAITRNLQVNTTNSSVAGTMGQMLALMQSMAGKPDPNYQIVLETGVVAGAMTNQIDRNLGTLNHRRSKGL